MFFQGVLQCVFYAFCFVSILLVVCCKNNKKRVCWANCNKKGEELGVLHLLCSVFFTVSSLVVFTFL